MLDFTPNLPHFPANLHPARPRVSLFFSTFHQAIGVSGKSSDGVVRRPSPKRGNLLDRLYNGYGESVG